MRPLVLLLHGAGGDETSLLPLARRLPAHVHRVLLRAPRRMARGGHYWYPVRFGQHDTEVNLQQVEAARRRLLAFLGELEQGCRFDPRQLYLVGFSQGGALASTLALSSPGRVRGLAMLGSRLLSHLEPTPDLAPALATLQVFMGHGRQDEVLRLVHAERAAAALRAAGAPVSWRLYEAGHELALPMVEDAAAWLRRQLPLPPGSPQAQP